MADVLAFPAVPQNKPTAWARPHWTGASYLSLLLATIALVCVAAQPPRLPPDNQTLPNTFVASVPGVPLADLPTPPMSSGDAADSSPNPQDAQAPRMQQDGAPSRADGGAHPEWHASSRSHWLLALEGYTPATRFDERSIG